MKSENILSTMLEEFVSFGNFWLPSHPEIKVAGKLSFSAEDGATLELIGSFYDSQSEVIEEVENIEISSELFPLPGLPNNVSGRISNFINPEENIILGLLENNEEVTLFRCYGRVSNHEFLKERTTLFFEIDYVFRKIHFEDEQDIKFKSISVQYSNLREWVGKSGIKFSESRDENKILISHQPPTSIHLSKIDELELNITFSQTYINWLAIWLGAVDYEAKIEQKTYLTIENTLNQSLDKCIELSINFRDFLSFAITKPTSITEVTGKIDIASEENLQEIKVTILFAFWNPVKDYNTKILPHKVLFLLSDIEDDLENIFESWLEKKEAYEPVFDLLMSTTYAPNLYLNYQFLNIVQALEAYHTSKYEGRYQDKKVYKKGIYKKFREILNDFPSENDDQGKGISDEFRNALKGKLKDQTRFTLETRLKELLNEVSPFLPDDFVGSIDHKAEFAHRAAETRNALTHHDKEKRKQAAKGQELFQIFHTLAVILRICLMKELNIKDDSIKALVKRSRTYKNEWKPPETA